MAYGEQPVCGNSNQGARRPTLTPLGRGEGREAVPGMREDG